MDIKKTELNAMEQTMLCLKWTKHCGASSVICYMLNAMEEAMLYIKLCAFIEYDFISCSGLCVFFLIGQYRALIHVLVLQTAS
jgi:hypothetical protein